MTTAEIRETISPLPLVKEVKGIEVCGLSGKKHIEVEITSADPQAAQPQVQQTLKEAFPGQKFRLLFFRSRK
jgi:hypothetical protein